MTTDERTYRILTYIKNHHEKPPSYNLIRLELRDELKLTDNLFYALVIDIATQRYLELKGENKTNGGWLTVLSKGDDYISNVIQIMKSPDTEFIQGKITESFVTHVEPQNKVVDHYFEITKNGVKRKYTPFKYLDTILECHFIAIDNEENVNMKISGCVNAKVLIKRKIREHDLTKRCNLDFSKIFEEIEDTMYQLNSYKELGIKTKKFTKDPNVSQPKANQTQVMSFDHDKFKLDFQMFFVPDNIMKYYMEWNEYIYLNTKTAKGIPVLRVAFELMEIKHKENKKLAHEFYTVFESYAQGFLRGIHSDFNPTINTPEAKKELILKAINVNLTHGFPETHNWATKEVWYEKASFFEMGEKFGKNYKAWMLVLETPNIYATEFPFNVKNYSDPQSETLTNSNNKAPSFKAEAIPSILDVLKAFFPAQDANTLNKLLNNPTKNLPQPLTFNEEGNKLADAFKRLYDSAIITGCTKTEMENWVLNNFNYTTRGKIQSFKKKYLNDIISTDSKPCKSPIINVEKAEGKMFIESSLRKKKNSEQV